MPKHVMSYSNAAPFDVREGFIASAQRHIHTCHTPFDGSNALHHPRQRDDRGRPSSFPTHATLRLAMRETGDVSNRHLQPTYLVFNDEHPRPVPLPACTAFESEDSTPSRQVNRP